MNAASIVVLIILLFLSSMSVGGGYYWYNNNNNYSETSPPETSPPKKDRGDTCSQPSECKLPLTCNNTSFTCEPKATRGRACATSSDCVDTLTCDATTYTCQAEKIPCVGEWSEWECTDDSGAKCGFSESGSNRKRTYNITQQAAHGGDACEATQGQIEEGRACSLPLCHQKDTVAKFTPHNDYFAGSAIVLDRHHVDCENQALNEFKLIKPDNTKISYTYKVI